MIPRPILISWGHDHLNVVCEKCGRISDVVDRSTRSSRRSSQSSGPDHQDQMTVYGIALTVKKINVREIRAVECFL